MHSNADITCALADTSSLFDTLLLMQPRSSSSGGKTRDEVIAETCIDIEKQLPPALAKFVANAPATDNLVERLCLQLESRVEDRASAVVTRLARDEVATHNLSRALEERVDAKLESFCTKLFGGTAAVLVLGAAWSWFGASSARPWLR